MPVLPSWRRCYGRPAAPKREPLWEEPAGRQPSDDSRPHSTGFAAHGANGADDGYEDHGQHDRVFDGRGPVLLFE